MYFVSYKLPLQQPHATVTADSNIKKMYPKREEFQWRPSPILCKRFDLSDPHMGKVSCFALYISLGLHDLNTAFSFGTIFTA